MFLKFTALAFTLLGALTAEAATGSGWDYDHPELWPEVNPVCGGKSNSPIPLDSMDCTPPQIDYQFNPGTCTIDNFAFSTTNNGVLMSLDSTNCENPTVKIPNIDSPYKHLQSHIHLSSEHSIDGGFYGAELHMVHGKVDDASPKLYAVVGTMIEPTAVDNNPMFEAWLQRWIKETNSCSEGCFDPAEVKAYDLNVYQGFVGKDFWHYEGGLTTPGCDEEVYWNFSTTPMKISVRQFQLLTEIILSFEQPDANNTCQTATLASIGGSTSRPPQLINGRSIVKYCSFNR